MSTASFNRRGLLLILSSPSGAGKSTLTQLLVRDDPKLKLSISVTTREKRGSEVNGVHYHFISETEFIQMRNRDELLEWAQVHSNFYGTPLKPVEDVLASGNDMMFDIDWQGSQQIVEKIPEDVVSIFLLPPSMVELKQRLERRAEDKADVIARRLKNAREEIAHWENYDYVLVNRDLDETYKQLRTIIQVERMRRSRQNGLPAFINELLK
ncbi:guanylate kinase [Microvirga sp. W0021]|uniref:Guanylate kinase n=1 Tax=Hohaiivirga grylli TaxID=3133970 RepID=A0ABV0BLV8_9HYPH